MIYHVSNTGTTMIEEHAGLWRDPVPLPPWLFRRGERGAAVKAPSGKPTANELTNKHR
jgi:hypothetical protein